MDRKTEQFAIQLLNKLKSKTAILFVSHRLNSLKNIADRIYIFENGTVSHCGTHEKLLETENFYSEYWGQLER